LRFIRLLLISLTCCFRSEAGIIWQIGVFDRSSAEFSPIIDPTSGERRIDYGALGKDPVFVVGQSDPARDWFSFQPGSATGGAGYRPHPFTIQFVLAESPSSRYRLRLALLAYSARLPVLEVSINGHRGWYLQEPKLDYEAGDQAVFFNRSLSLRRGEQRSKIEQARTS
jgi:hypothetical protein